MSYSKKLCPTSAPKARYMYIDCLSIHGRLYINERLAGFCFNRTLKLSFLNTNSSLENTSLTIVDKISSLLARAFTVVVYLSRLVFPLLVTSISVNNSPPGFFSKGSYENRLRIRISTAFSKRLQYDSSCAICVLCLSYLMKFLLTKIVTIYSLLSLKFSSGKSWLNVFSHLSNVETWRIR